MSYYLKLRRPDEDKHSAFVFIPVPAGIMRSEILTEVDREALQRQVDYHRREGRAIHHYVMWRHGQQEQPRLLEAIIPGAGDWPDAVVLTNFDTVLNSYGAKVERLFRPQG